MTDKRENEILRNVQLNYKSVKNKVGTKENSNKYANINAIISLIIN